MKNITFVHDTIKDNIPMMNGFSESQSALYLDIMQLMKHINVSFVSIDEVNAEADDVLYIYPIELLKFHYSEVLTKINEQSLIKIKNLKISILIYFPTEGFAGNELALMLDDLHFQFEKFKLHENLRFLIFGNLLIKNSYNDYLSSVSDIKELKIKFKNGREYILNSHSYSGLLVPDFFKKIRDIKFHEVYGLNYFETRYKNNLEKRWNSVYHKSREEITLLETVSSIKTKNFLSYNGNFRSGRLALVSEIIRNNLDNKSYISFIGGTFLKIENCVPEARKMLSNEGKTFLEEYVNNWTPKYIDINAEEKFSDILKSDKRHYLNTYFSLVTETETSKNVLFLTEKIFKPIVFYHPFIVWGQPHTLTYLRSLGYETFPEIFSEEYDEIEDEHLRLELIVDQISKFVKLTTDEKDAKFASVIKKLEHNRNLFFSDHNRFGKDLQHIFEDIQKNL
jgi:hypothetical protein